MRRALRAHLRDVLAILGLVLAGLFAVTVILVNQRASLPSWVPVIGTDFFHLEADFSTAQAVTPGQGQSVDIAGIKVGEVSGVKLENGHAVVSMSIDNKYAAADPRQRVAAAPPEDGPQRHGGRGRSGHHDRSGDEGEHDGPAGLDPASGEPGRDPRITGRRHPAVPEAAAGERRGGPRPGPGTGREALQRAAPSRPVRARHLEDQRRARDPSPEHRQLDPQLPASLHRARQSRSGPRQLRGLLERSAGLLRQGAGLDPERRRGAACDAPADQGRPDQRQRLGAPVRAGAEEVDPGGQGDGAGAAGAAALLPADGRPDPESDPALHQAGGEPRPARRPDRPGPGHGHSGPARPASPGSTTVSTPSPSTRPARPRATCSTSPGSTTT